MTGPIRSALIVASALAMMTERAVAQSLESRISAARGTVGFEFTTRRNVCGTGRSISISDDTSAGWNTRTHRYGINIGRREAGETLECEQGPARVILNRENGKVSDVRVSVGGRAERADTELGAIPMAEAARYLLAIAPALAGRPAENATMGAAIADAPMDWRRMLAIARDNDATESSRKASLFWVSQQAGAVATSGLTDVAMDNDAQASVRSDALFFLAQRPKGEGIPGLVRVVRESKSAKLRKDAIWHLSQSRDPRALELFEQLLSGK
ncbi:MAG: hypothetical protein V4550_04345 [Gemmatimonadota bacterium]